MCQCLAYKLAKKYLNLNTQTLLWVDGVNFHSNVLKSNKKNLLLAQFPNLVLDGWLAYSWAWILSPASDVKKMLNLLDFLMLQ
jgi:hypothetical protein